MMTFTSNWPLGCSKRMGDTPGRWKCPARLMKKLLLAICLAGQVWMDMLTSWMWVDIDVRSLGVAFSK